MAINTYPITRSISRLPVRSALLLRRGVHRTPAPFEKAGETLLFMRGAPRPARSALLLRRGVHWTPRAFTDVNLNQLTHLRMGQ